MRSRCAVVGVGNLAQKLQEIVFVKQKSMVRVQRGGQGKYGAIRSTRSTESSYNQITPDDAP